MYRNYPDRAHRRLPLAPRGLAMLVILLFGSVGSVAAIGTYLWSLRVASVKAQATSLDERIAATRDQIGRLRMELVLRTRLVQQEWWAPRLGLQTPGPFQYGRSDDQLHALADARRMDIAARGLPPLLAAPVVGPRTDYEPKARHALDSLIDDVSR